MKKNEKKKLIKIINLTVKATRNKEIVEELLNNIDLIRKGCYYELRDDSLFIENEETQDSYHIMLYGDDTTVDQIIISQVLLGSDEKTDTITIDVNGNIEHATKYVEKRINDNKTSSVFYRSNFYVNNELTLQTTHLKTDNSVENTQTYVVGENAYKHKSIKTSEAKDDKYYEYKDVVFAPFNTMDSKVTKVTKKPTELDRETYLELKKR